MFLKRNYRISSIIAHSNIHVEFSLNELALFRILKTLILHVFTCKLLNLWVVQEVTDSCILTIKFVWAQYDVPINFDKALSKLKKCNLLAFLLAGTEVNGFIFDHWVPEHFQRLTTCVRDFLQVDTGFIHEVWKTNEFLIELGLEVSHQGDCSDERISSFLFWACLRDKLSVMWLNFLKLSDAFKHTRCNMFCNWSHIISELKASILWSLLKHSKEVIQRRINPFDDKLSEEQPFFFGSTQLINVLLEVLVMILKLLSDFLLMAFTYIMTNFFRSEKAWESVYFIVLLVKRFHI